MRFLILIALITATLSSTAQENLSFTAYGGGIRPGLSGFNKDKIAFESVTRFLVGAGLSYRSNGRFEYGLNAEHHVRQYTLLVKDCNCKLFIDDFSSIGLIFRTSYSLLNPAKRSSLLIGGGFSLLMDYGSWNILHAKDSSDNYILEQNYRFDLYQPYLLAFGSLSYEYEVSPVFRLFADLRVHAGIYNSGTVKDVRVVYQNTNTGVAFDNTFRFNNFDKYLSFGFKYNLFGRN